MDIHTNLSLIHGNFFFVDVVGLSDPKMSVKTQIKKIEVLNSSILNCDIYKNTQRDSMLMLPSGDGMCICFLQGPELPLLLSIQLHKKLEEYNKGKIPTETVRVRIGLHHGNCFIVKDLHGNKNLWGPGIIIARRIMDLGDDQHILISPILAEDLRELSDEYHEIIKPVHDFVLKHGITMLVYSAYGDGFGNPKHPSRGEYIRSKYGDEIIKLQKTTLYPYISVSLTVKDVKTMLVEHHRKYEIANISDDPIKTVLHGIATDVEKYSLNDLNIKIFDEHEKELKISSVNVDRPTTKEFTTTFNEPICKGEKGRKYTLIYEVEEPERYYENAFLIDSEKFILNFTYPDTGEVKPPKLFEIHQETEDKRELDTSPKIKNDSTHKTYSWSMDNVKKGKTFRIEW